MRKKISSWIKVLLVSVFVVGFVVVSVLSITQSSAHAVDPDVFLNNTDEDGGGGTDDGGSGNTSPTVNSVSQTDWSVVKQNVLFKTIYSNLEKCYSAMQPTISKDVGGVWAGFNSDVYFNNDALTNVFLRFPYGVGEGNSSCPKMITGWNSNWFTSFFTGATGEYSGLLSMNTSAKVPTETASESNATIMPEFLTGIGYEGEKSEIAESGRKCFYLELTLNDQLLTDLSVTEGDRPANLTFHTPDYCANFDSNGYLVKPYNDAIIRLVGNNDSYHPAEYDSGHLTNANNVFDPMFVSSKGVGLTVPTWLGDEWGVLEVYLGGILSGGNFIYTNNQGNFTPNNHFVNFSMLPSKQDDYDAHCADFGYKWCQLTIDVAGSKKKVNIRALSEPGAQITYSTLKNTLVNLFQRAGRPAASAPSVIGIQVFTSVRAVDYDISTSSASLSTFNKGDSNADFMKYFLGDTSKYNSGKFYDAEKYVLYYTYLKDYYNTQMFDVPMSDAVSVKWWNETTGAFEQKYLTGPGQHAGDDRYILSNEKWAAQTASDWSIIANLLAGIDPEKAFGELGVLDQIVDTGVINPDAGSNAEEAKNPCLSNAASLGWILCPVLDVGAQLTTHLYGWISDTWLVVSADDLGDGTRAAWETFRDFANMLFVVALVVVILSQVTGLGLSNYGIKKMLPTLIMVAVLVNLSFIFCQIAVDISNIVGSGIYNLFKDLGNSLQISYTEYNYTGILERLFGSGFSSGVFTTAAVAGAAVGIFWAVHNPGSLLTLVLIAFVTAAFSIFFFFLIITVRKVAIIILVTLSPLAIICYALPNMKKMTTKWTHAFWSLLVLYPICGLMMGGGEFVSGVLLANNSEEVMVNLVAMLVQVIPFFFIPTLLKNSLQAIGNIGAKLSSFGQRWGSRLAGGVSRSEALKDFTGGLDFRAADFRQRMMDRAKKSKLLGGAAAGYENSALGRSARRGNARQIAAYRKRTLDNIQNEDIARNTNAASIQAEAESMRMKQHQDLVNNTMSSLVNGGLSYQDASGAEVKVDANNLGDLLDPNDPNSGLNPRSLKAALDHFMKQYNDSGGQDEDAAIKAQAVMQALMDRGGDKGQTIVTEALKRESADGNGNGKRTLAATNLSEFATRNGKWMSNLKSTDRAAFSLVGDLAQADRKIKSKAEYAVAGANSINPTQVPGLSDGFFDSWQEQIDNRTFANNLGARENLLRLDETFQQAVRDPRVAQSLKPETLDKMNKIHEEAQKYRYDDWAKNEWAKDEWRKDQYVHDQIAENAWRTANGKAANYTLNDDEKVQAQQDYADAQWRAKNGKAANYTLTGAEQTAALNKFGSTVAASDTAQAATMRSSMTSAQINEALSGYQEMTGAQVANAKKNYKNSMTNAQIQDAQTKYTHDDFVSKFGNNAKLEIGKEVKVPRREASMPAGWMRGAGGVWVDMSATGAGRQLTLAEQRRAEAIEKHNIDAQIENEVNGF